MIIRKIVNLTKADYPEVFRLSKYAFQYHLDDEAYRKKSLEAERHKIYGYKIENKLAGKLHIIPLEIFIKGELFTMGGISSVATWPEYRGQKIAEQLIEQSLIELKKGNIALAYLHPFNAGFYRRFGFEFTFDSIEYTIPIEKLRHPWRKQGQVERDNINLLELNQVYETFIKKFNGGLKRDENWWEQRVLTDAQTEIIMIKDDLGYPQAYLIYKVENSRLEVIEMVYTNQAYKESIYNFIMKHQTTIKSVKMPTYEEDLLSYILSNPTFTQKKQPYFMARIINVESFLNEYPFEIKDELSIKLFIKDDFLADNTGLYNISAQGIIKTEDLVTKDYLMMNIGDLTSLLMGYKTMDDLKKLNKVKGSETDLKKLASVLNPQSTYLLDYF